MTAASKKPPKTAKPDVEEPGKSAPPATSKPVLVSNRALLKDPMMVDETATEENEAVKNKELAHSTGPKLKPLKEPEPQPEPKAEETEAAVKKQETEPEQPADNEDAPPAKTEAKPKKQDEAAEAAEHAKRDAAVQELIDSRKYELPINAVEKRKTKHFVVLGVLLAILLVLVWIDIAADAGLIHISGIKPVTHFFSN